jgi:hypothetical protein
MAVFEGAPHSNPARAGWDRLRRPKAKNTIPAILGGSQLGIISALFLKTQGNMEAYNGYLHTNNIQTLPFQERQIFTST